MIWLNRFVFCDFIQHNPHQIQSFPNTTRGYRRLSLVALAGRLAKRVRTLALLPNTHSVISVQFLSPISSNVSSVRTWCRRLTFLFFTEPVSLILLACLLIVLGLGTGHPGNFSPPLWARWQHVRLSHSGPGFDLWLGQVSWVRFFLGFFLTCRINVGKL